MLRLIQSNHMPVLAQLFCEQSQQVADPFIPTTVVVQSFGIGQWLKLQLAEHQGISANLDCILPANYIWRLYRELLPDTKLPEESPFDRDRLAWRLMRLIPEMQEDVFKSYLSATGDPDIRLFQLSYQIAQLYDQYLVYRPQWPVAWERDVALLDETTLAHQQWQIKLWQHVIADAPGIANLHRARLHQSLLNRINEQPSLPDGVSNKLSIFGLSSMAKMQLDTFRALARIIDVDVYFLNPCQHYWGDIVAPKDKAKRSVRALLNTEQTLSDEDYLTVGNPLLGSLGKQGREYLELLLETDDISTHELFVDITNDSILGTVKTDILNLEYGGSFDALPAQRPLPDGNSIQIHAAHSRMREVEILYDQLLAIFDRQPDIVPKNVIVMAPDISAYAPFINAVFKDKIHFGIADRTLIQQSTLIASFLKIVALPGSRLTSVEVMDLLEVPAIARRFELDEEALNRISSWIHEAGIRWEVNGDAKADRWQLPPENLNTWQFGLDRMLLGYAMDADEGLFAEQLAFPVDTADSELLGSLCHIIDLLTQTREALSHPHRAENWRVLLNNILYKFFLPADAEAIEVTQLQSVLDRIERDTKTSEFEDAFSNQLMRYWLEQQLSLAHQIPGFITGGITFATLIPMRSIPFDVVCLLGMNDADFPREERPLSFDLMHIDGARKGDRSKRTDDRYLFLEALLSAQRTFYISYAGKGARDNSERPPSTVVGELLDYITGIYPDFSVVEHPLQPFSRHYYDGTLLSYQKIWFNALQQPPVVEPFIAGELTVKEELKAESMEQLASFYRHPAQYYFHNCLGVFFGQDNIELKESESFVLDALEKYELTDLALKAMLDDVDANEWRRMMVAAGKVLNNNLGDSYLDQQQAIARDIHTEIQTLVQGTPSSLREQVALQDNKLSFSIHNIYDEQRIDIRPGTLRKRQLLEIWIKHLCLNANEHHYQTLTLSKGKHRAAHSIFSPLPATDAQQILQRLLENHDAGILYPLHFLPECSFTFASVIANGKSREEAFQQVNKVWSQDMPGTEGQDPYWRRITSSNNIFDESFEHLAIETYTPLLASWTES